MDPCLIATITDSIMQLGPDGNRKSPRVRENNDAADVREADRQRIQLINDKDAERDWIIDRLNSVWGRIDLNQHLLLQPSQVNRAKTLLDQVIACVGLSDDTEIPESPDASRPRTPETL
jgi:hypothetical protein